MRLCLTENVFILPSLLFKSYWIYNFTLQFFFSKVVRPLFHCFLFLVLQLRRTIKCSFQGPWVLVSLEADDLLFSLSDNVNSNDVPWYGSFCTHSTPALLFSIWKPWSFIMGNFPVFFHFLLLELWLTQCWPPVLIFPFHYLFLTLF